MKTIAKNATRKIAAIRATHTRVLLFTLSNNFHAVEIPAENAWAQLAKYDFAKLRDNGDGSYTIYVHSNCWIDLRTPKAAAQ
jgi:hypothetical protein